MIEDFVFKNAQYRYSDTDTDGDELDARLGRQQRRLKELDIPVLIQIEGWESSGKGRVIRELIRGLDPRSFKVSVFEEPTDEERHRPFLWRFWRKLPRRGEIAVFDRSLYFKDMNDPEIEPKELTRDMRDIAAVERQLYEDGTIILKFFLHIKEKTQAKRIAELQKNPYRDFLVSRRDLRQNRHYKKYRRHLDRVLKLSNFEQTPWSIVNAEDIDAAAREVLGLTVEHVEAEMNRILLERAEKPRAAAAPSRSGTRPLDRLDLSKALTEEDYREQVRTLQERARDLQYEMYTRGKSCILAFEGMDAAGKGGAIERLTKRMDPRGYEVVPTAAPDATEKQYHYLWRFYRDLPGKGRLAIFDRSWYGRVLVERVEAFASRAEWERAYDEINETEEHWVNQGAMVLKFFLYINRVEQLKRFQEREAEADKLYKITEEDWRNRKKWNAYLPAMNEMLERTDTSRAPWVVLSGQDKYDARVQVLDAFIRHAEHFLNLKQNR